RSPRRRSITNRLAIDGQAQARGETLQQSVGAAKPARSLAFDEVAKRADHAGEKQPARDRVDDPPAPGLQVLRERSTDAEVVTIDQVAHFLERAEAVVDHLEVGVLVDPPAAQKAA